LSGAPIEKARETWRQALAILERRLQDRLDDPELLVTRGLYRAKIGDTAAAEDAELAVLLSPANATVRYVAALTFAVGGDRPRALDQVRSAVRQGYSIEEIRRAPEFSALRGDPAFEQALTRPAPH